MALGLTLALAERIARKAWLEICYGGSEIRTVNLGLHSVTIGSDARLATIYARGAAPVAFRYSLEGGKVKRQDAATYEVTELRPGEPQPVGAVMVTLRTAGTRIAAAARCSPPAVQPPPARPAAVSPAASTALARPLPPAPLPPPVVPRAAASQTSVPRQPAAGGSRSRGAARPSGGHPSASEAGRGEQPGQLPVVRATGSGSSGSAVLHPLRSLSVAIPSLRDDQTTPRLPRRRR